MLNGEKTINLCEAGVSEFSRGAGGEAARAIRTTTAARTTVTTAHITNRQAGWEGHAILVYKVVNQISVWIRRKGFCVFERGRERVCMFPFCLW